MVRHGAGDRRSGLYGVETIHLIRAVGHPATGGEIPSMTNVAGTVIKEVRIQGQDDVRLIKVVSRLELGPKSHPSTVSNVVPGYRLVVMPLGARKLMEEHRREVADLLDERAPAARDERITWGSGD